MRKGKELINLEQKIPFLFLGVEEKSFFMRSIPVCS